MLFKVDVDLKDMNFDKVCLFFVDFVFMIANDKSRFIFNLNSLGKIALFNFILCELAI
jgi:hypothetical protein